LVRFLEEQFEELFGGVTWDDPQDVENDGVDLAFSGHVGDGIEESTHLLAINEAMAHVIKQGDEQMLWGKFSLPSLQPLEEFPEFVDSAFCEQILFEVLGKLLDRLGIKGALFAFGLSFEGV
jgi:hypothetical protein